MRPKSSDNNNTNTNWQITYSPAPSETELYDICGLSFTTKCALKRHSESMHSNKTYICPQCDYQSPRVDNIRRHLRGYHRLIHTSALIANLQMVVTLPMKAEAPTATSKKIQKICQSQPRRLQNIIKMKLESINVAPKPKKLHTKPVTTPPKCHQKSSTTLNTT